MLTKLEHYGIRGVANKLIESYLTDRHHCVKLGKEKSNNIKILHGVPQGSVLGPLFFLLYINDLHLAIKHSSPYHFADDTSLLSRGKSLKTLNKNVNQDLSRLSNWLRANKIALNTSKTEIIIFKNSTLKILKHLNFRLDGQKLFLTNAVSYLGVKLDEHLSWKNYLNELFPKLARAIGILSKIRHLVDFKTLRSIYYSLFNSHLNYSLLAWGYIPDRLLSKLASLQNKAMRVLNFQDFRAPVQPLYINSRILPFQNELKLRHCLFAYDILRKKHLLNPSLTSAPTWVLLTIIKPNHPKLKYP